MVSCSREQWSVSLLWWLLEAAGVVGWRGEGHQAWELRSSRGEGRED